jgi:hypothetical protein
MKIFLKLDLKNNQHPTKHLQSAWNKYGEENFEFTILEEVENGLQFQKEQEYLNKYRPFDNHIGYNTLRHSTWETAAIQTKFLCGNCSNRNRYYIKRSSGEKMPIPKLDWNYCSEFCGRYQDEDFYDSEEWDWRKSQYEYKQINDWDGDDFLAHEWDERMSK